jgi:hypothetical protein
MRGGCTGKLLLILTAALLLQAESIHSQLPEPGIFKTSDELALHGEINATEPLHDKSSPGRS